MLILLHEHVLQSNLIEGVSNKGEYLTNHLLAARCVELAAAVKEVLHPRLLHAVLFDGLPLPREHTPGEYRHCEVTVSSYKPPVYRAVASYMAGWWDFVLDDEPWGSHAHFEAIHPFVDGNGRVGRLVYWNQQLVAGVEPELILAEEKYAYYARLEQWRGINWGMISEGLETNWN